MDHTVAIVDGALHAEAVEDEMEFACGDEAVLVLVVEIEGVAELGGSAVFGAGAAEGGEFGERDEAVVVGIEFIHDALELVVVGKGRAERVEDGAKFRYGDLAVTVGVESFENLLHLFHALEVKRRFLFARRV